MRNTAAGATQVQSVDRALAILDLLAAHRELGVTEIAGSLGVHKSTASRLLSVLEGHRLVDRMGERGRYRLGFGVVRLAGATIAELDVVRESREVCRRLAAELGETINIAVLDAGAAVNLTQDLGGSAVAVHNWIGQRTLLHVTSSGKVLLAGADGQEVDAAVERGLPQLTPFTITDPQRLRDELERVRRRGWAATVSELEIGLNAVAVPVRGAGGAVVAAVSMSGPGYRLPEESFPAVSRTLAAAAREIGARIGFVPGG